MGSRVRGEDAGAPGGDASGVWRGAQQEGLPGQVRREVLENGVLLLALCTGLLLCPVGFPGWG